ncbi:hypothetical protein BMF94_1642 [Rhodotorula taiwanensis]|uniref:Importin N-terminal domain-containing protein n=1 Tax=Rhodotorula taiwanensis TaxID=741276 RepID=A0A2S5BES6_9BASI|nr:hypothetical protein BMF94_1642 [Rhodotorula taiwanensis]
MADQQFTQSLFATLEQTIAPDTQVIKAATVQLNQTYYTDARCVPALFEIATSGANPAIRQLALVELRKRVSAKKHKQWLAQPQEVRAALKARLLEFLLTETNSQARTASARLVSTIARFELDKGVWPELLPWMWSMTSSTTVSHREVSLQTTFMLLDSIAIAPTSAGNKPENHIPALLTLLAKTVADPESLTVRTWSVRALGKLAEYVEPGEQYEISALQGMIPSVVQVLQQALEANDEPAAKSIFEFFDTVSLSECPIITPHITSLIEFLLRSAGNQAYDNDLRIMCLNALLFLVRFKKGKIQQLNLAGSIITALLPIGAEPEPVDIEDDAPSRTAFRVIDSLATSLPPTQVFPPLFEQVRALSASPDPNLRKSAIMAFGVVIEGCSLFIQPHLESMWPLIQNGLQDPEVVVRKAACTALGCLCEVLEEECAKQHAMLLPLISKLMGDAATQRQACVALDCLLEVLGSDIEPYIPSLMEALVQLLDSAPLSLKPTVVGAIGSAAHASKTKFAPYFDAVMQRLVQFLQLTEEGEELDLRGVSQDTVGTLAEAVGGEQFRPYYAPLMQQAIAAIGIENAPNLKECSYIFFAVVSRVYREEFAQYLPVIMPILLAAIAQEEADASEFLGGDAAADFTTGVDGDEDDGDYEDIDEDINSDDEDAFFKASTQIAIEKECAADALTEVFDHTGKHFLPYVEAAVKALLPGLDHTWHDGIRKSSVASLLGFIATLNRVSEAPKWTKGSQGNSLGPDVSQLVQAVVPQVLEMWKSEDERDVANELCNSFSAALMSVGPALIVPNYVQPICEEVSKILQRKAACQLDDDEDEEDEREQNGADQSEYDAALIGAAADLVGSLATTLGADFAPLFSGFLPDMVKYYDPARSTADRSTAIGSLAEIVNGMEGAITPFTERLFPLFVQALADPEPEVQSNAAFATGSLMYHSQTDLSSQYLPVLSALHPLFGLPRDGQAKHENAIDNACGAVSRMIVKNQQAVPLDQVLPVLLQALPLRRDMAETEWVFQALLVLLQQQNPLVLSSLDHVLAVFAKALASTRAADGSDVFYPNEGAELNAENKAKVIEIVKALAASQPEKVQQAGLATFLA